METLSYVLAIIGIGGMWITGKKNRWGWVVGIVYNALWILYAVGTAQYAFILVCAVFIILYSINFFAWSKDE